MTSIDEARGYIGALIDGEGCIYNYGSAKRIVIGNSDLNILEAGQAYLTQLGIKSSIYDATTNRIRRLGYKKAYQLVINHRNNLSLIYENVPIKSNKREKLRLTLLSYSKRLKVKVVD